MDDSVLHQSINLQHPTTPRKEVQQPVGIQGEEAAPSLQVEISGGLCEVNGPSIQLESW